MATIIVNNQDLDNAATIDTYGIYKGDRAVECLIEDYNEEHNTDYNYDDFDWNYDHKQIVKELADLRAETLQNDVDIIHYVKVLGTGSPREYNFSTDWATFEIDYDEDVVEKYIKDNQADYDQWYKDSGWYSSTEWRDEGPRKDEYRQTAKLSYYLNHKVYPEFDDWYLTLAEAEDEIYTEHITMTPTEEHNGETN